MIFGPEKVISCPHCAALARLFTLRSGNTQGAVFWTDGKMSAPMLPQAPTITGCHACEKIFWVADARIVGEMDLGEATPYPIEWATAPAVAHMNEAELLDALRAELATSPEQARQLRTLAWWAANDARRPPAFDPDWESDTPLSPAAIENLEQLITLVDPDSPTGRLMHAEAARELGRFDAALSALAELFSCSASAKGC